MSYRTIFREAVGEIPPTSIDVDRVIAGQRRARRFRRVGMVALAVAAVGVVAIGATAVTGPPRADMPAAPSPTKPAVRTPTPTPGDSFTPMDMAIFEAIDRVAPDLEWAPGLGASPGAKSEWVSGPTTRDGIPFGYMGQGRVRSGDRAGHFSVQTDDDLSLLSPCSADTARTSGCAITTGPAGEKIRSSSNRSPADKPDGSPSGGIAVSSDVFVARTDGVVLIVSVDGDDENPPLTIAQLTALALDPAVAGLASPPLRADEEARRRLIDSAVFASLRRQVPSATGAEWRGGLLAPADLDAGWTGTEGKNTADSYWGQGRVMVDGVAGSYSVQIHREDPGLSGDLTCDEPSKTYACTAGEGPNGERFRTVTNTTRNDSGVSAERSVAVLRKDGSWLAVTHTADAKGKFALTAAQQQAAAFDPTVALAGR
ncbi:hypothetical protein ABT346_08445 [Micromonospora peucetia]|uniref:hypothetical protein n=1 Tax=Micromonospora peucetia TaxID=47871 RepID=UPI003316D237